MNGIRVKIGFGLLTLSLVGGMAQSAAGPAGTTAPAAAEPVTTGSPSVPTPALAEPPPRRPGTTNASELNMTGATADTKFSKEIWVVKRTPAPDMVKSNGLVVRGPLVQTVQRIKRGGLLHMLNPFAPTDYGTGGGQWVSWDPTVTRGPRPRGFRDAVSEEALPLIVVGR